jgi:hypothetical protein
MTYNQSLVPAKGVPVLAETAEAIEESHHQHGLTDSVSVETNKRAHREGPGM